MRKFIQQYADQKGAIIEKPDVGILLAAGTTVPADASAGYATGCIFLHTDGGENTAIYVNDGSATSCDFNPLSTAPQQAAYTQTYATADRTHANPTAATLTVSDGAGTNDNTIGAITADASVIAAVQELADEINKLVADMADVKQVVNAIIDDLQALGFAG